LLIDGVIVVVVLVVVEVDVVIVVAALGWNCSVIVIIVIVGVLSLLSQPAWIAGLSCFRRIVCSPRGCTVVRCCWFVVPPAGAAVAGVAVEAAGLSLLLLLFEILGINILFTALPPAVTNCGTGGAVVRQCFLATLCQQATGPGKPGPR
jgi:hypothetical protein